ncbi:MAG: hypothetical protein Q9M22_01920 [Mariprofundaceae bacterium]|nr:hypothetical protein [Mariprofundaceae bacterium]
MRHLLLFGYSILFYPVVVFAAEQALPQRIEWHQQACQFLEAEGKDHHYQSKSAADCKAINQRDGKARVKQAKRTRLKAGVYIFRIYNDDVAYPLGFWLRGKGLGRITLPSVSGGGIQTGHFKDYKITLKTGDYLYSCPLNPTPDYHLTVIP